MTFQDDFAESVDTYTLPTSSCLLNGRQLCIETLQGLRCTVTKGSIVKTMILEGVAVQKSRVFER